MAEASWTNKDKDAVVEKAKTNRLKFIIGGVVLFGAIIFLIVNAMSGNTQLYKTVDEFYSDQARLTGRDLRVAGWLLGDSIEYTQIDANNSRLEFDVVDDINNPGQRMHIVALNEPMPDLLQDRAQALVEGRAEPNGVFMANPGGLMLKCPTKYEEMGEEHPGA